MHQSFNFQKLQGAQILMFFVKIDMKLHFTRSKAEKQIRNLSFKNYYFGPLKSAFLVFVEKPPPQICFFFVFRLWFGFKNIRHTIGLLAGIFENAQKKFLTVKNAILAVFGG